MKTITCLMLLHFFASSTCYSLSDSLPPEKNSRFGVGFSLGPCFPLGKFNSYQPSSIGLSPSNYAGEAKTGFGASIDLNYLFGNHFSIAGSVYGSTFKAGIADIINTAGTGQAYGPEVEPGNWIITGLLAGGQYHFNLGKINMVIQALAGIQKSNSPKVRYKSYFLNPDFPQPITYETDRKQPSITSKDPAYRFSMRAAYPWTKKKLLYLQGSYTSSSGTFEGENIISDVKNLGYNNTISYTWPAAFTKRISFLSVLFGVSFKL